MDSKEVVLEKSVAELRRASHSASASNAVDAASITLLATGDSWAASWVDDTGDCEIKMKSWEADSGISLLTVAAPDRNGLLSDILETLKDSGVDVVRASVATPLGKAHDVFELKQALSDGVVDPAAVVTAVQNVLESGGKRRKQTAVTT